MAVDSVTFGTGIPRQSQTAAQSLSGNFDTFLTLLTTQLKNQDPLSPMDSNQFTQQLVQFSAVEQQINTNANLENLIALSKNQAGANAVSYLGKTVTLTNGLGALNGGEANWNYTLATGAQDAVMTVTDSKGKIVYVGHGDSTAGEHEFAWDGRDNAGNQLTDGSYKLNVSAVDAAGQTVSTTVRSQGTVSEVDLTGDEPTLMIGAMSVPLSQATLISDASTATDSTLDALAAPLTAPLRAAASLVL